MSITNSIEQSKIYDFVLALLVHRHEPHHVVNINRCPKKSAVNLGQVAVSGGSDIDVFIDQLIGGSGSNRGWYDGVGYELVSSGNLVPTPAALPAGLAMPGLAAMRRRRHA